jgi:uncharacterized membrane protein
MTSRLPAVLATLALAGLGVSTYLTVTHWGGTPISCAGVGDCNYVNSSPYSTLAGVPVSALGALLYAGLLFAAIAWWRWPDDERLPIVYWGLALAGFGYAAYLTYVELYVLDAVCVWCMTSATILTVSLTLSTVALLRPDPYEAAVSTSKARRRSSDAA